MKTIGRSHRAFLRALPPTMVTAIVAVPIVGIHIARSGRWITTSIAIAIGLMLVVFLTYFSLSVAGYRVNMREPFAARLHFITRVTDRLQTYVIIIVKVFRRYFERAPGWVLLTTRGRKTGLPREVLLPCERFREGLIIISTYGRRSNWIRNIEDDPTVAVTCAGWSLPARAEIIDDLETKRSLVSAHPFSPPAPVFPINTIHVTLLRPVTTALMRWWVTSRPVVFVRLALAPSAHQVVSVQQEFGGPP